MLEEEVVAEGGEPVGLPPPDDELTVDDVPLLEDVLPPEDEAPTDEVPPEDGVE